MSSQLHHWLYAKEKLLAAVETLATSGAPLKQKLAEVWIYHLMHLREENMPTAELWSRIQRVGKEFSYKTDEHIGSARASMHARRTSTHEKIAGEIWEIFLECFRAILIAEGREAHA